MPAARSAGFEERFLAREIEKAGHNMNRYVMPILLLVTLALTGLGLVMISSTSVPLPDAASQLKRQVAWLVAGLAIFAAMGWVDYKVWRRWIWPIFGFLMFLMVLLFVPGIGMRVKGSSRWISMAGFNFQPSEFLRLALVMLVAHGLASHQSRIREMKWGFFWPIGVIAVPLVLLRMEPDLGTMVLVTTTTLAMAVVAGGRFWPLAAFGGVGGTAFVGMLMAMPERRARVLAFLHPEANREGKFFQIWQGILAFGSGGREGLGLGNSRQKMFYLPESTTDSIFPIIGEELGFYISIAVVICYVLILLCGLWIAMKSRETYGMLLGFGLVFGLTLQAMINIGTVTGCIPPKGMPLPFVSYGGSNLVISYAAIGLLVSIHRQGLRQRRMNESGTINEKTPRI